MGTPPLSGGARPSGRVHPYVRLGDLPVPQLGCSGSGVLGVMVSYSGFVGRPTVGGTACPRATFLPRTEGGGQRVAARGRTATSLSPAASSAAFNRAASPTTTTARDRSPRYRFATAWISSRLAVVP